MINSVDEEWPSREVSNATPTAASEVKFLSHLWMFGFS